jgi:carboxypeptidase PM20D1
METRPKKFPLRLIAVVLILIAALITVLLLRTLTIKRPHFSSFPETHISLDSLGLAQRLSRAITFKTVSYQDLSKIDINAFLEFHQWLKVAYPRVHAKLKRQTLDRSLLYEWTGSDPSRPPLIFLAHIDVVPVLDEKDIRWKYPPFSGTIADGFVWGRGAIDDKDSLLGLLEATEGLLKNNFQPSRTLYFAFGQDEEVGGVEGAKKIADRLQQRHVKPEAVFDEGGYIVQKMIAGIESPVALIGIAEKGYATLELKITTQPGHSMAPPDKTAIGMLSEAIVRLETHPFPKKIRGATYDMLQWLAPAMPLGSRLAIANLWLLEPWVIPLLAKNPASRASLQTTTAATVFHAGEKDNVLPAEAKATVNFRILPGETVASVLAHVQKLTADLPIEIKPTFESRNPSSISSPRTKIFETMAGLTVQKYPGTVVAPYLFIGGSDSQHFSSFNCNIYRYLPVHFQPSDLARVHGTDERIGIADYNRAVQFLVELIKNTQ